MLLDDQGNPIPLEQELNMYKRIINRVKKDYPLFVVKLHILGLKLLGEEHA